MKMISHRPKANRAEALIADTWSDATTAAPTDDITSALLDAPLFAGMDEREVSAALGSFDEVRYATGNRVVLEGLRGSDFSLVVVGTAAVLVDGWPIARLGPGDFFGELAVLGDGLRTASVRAETPLHCMILPNGRLEQLILDHPQLGINILHALAGRLSDLTTRRQPPATEVSQP